jgi:hypothetical protein
MARSCSSAGPAAWTPFGGFPWNRRVSNRVEFATAGSPAELIELATRRPQTILFLPQRGDASRHLTGTGGRLQPVFADAQVTLAAAVERTAEPDIAPPPGSH